MREFTDEIVLFMGLGAAYLLITSVVSLELISLWGSLACIVLTSLYYSFTFFRSDELFKKLMYFLILVILVMLYFALVYRASGIIDSSTGELMKPGWLDAIYFSVVTWTTLGYGDFRPTDDTKIWVMVEALMGYVFMGLFLAKILFLAKFHSERSVK